MVCTSALWRLHIQISEQVSAPCLIQTLLTCKGVWLTDCANNLRPFQAEYIQYSDSIGLRFNSDLNPEQIPIGTDTDSGHFAPIRIEQEEVERLQCPGHLHKRSIRQAVCKVDCCGAQWL